MENITLNENMSLATLLEEYEAQKRQAEQINREEASEQEQAMLAEYEANKELLARASASLDYVKNSTSVIAVGDPTQFNDKVVTLLPDLEFYCESAVVLTGGFDEKLQDALAEARGYNAPNPMLEDFINAPLAVDEVKNGIDVYTASIAPDADKSLLEQISVGDMLMVVDNVEKEMQEHNIDKNNVIEATRQELKSANYLGISKTVVEINRDREGVLDKEQNKETKDREPVTAVISNDGYVMNTSEEVTMENVAEYDQIAENGNEMRDNGTPRETTTDPAEVGGKVKLEQANDRGTIEVENGEPSAEERASKNNFNFDYDF